MPLHAPSSWSCKSSRTTHRVLMGCISWSQYLRTWTPQEQCRWVVVANLPCTLDDLILFWLWLLLMLDRSQNLLTWGVFQGLWLAISWPQTNLARALLLLPRVARLSLLCYRNYCEHSGQCRQPPRYCPLSSNLSLQNIYYQKSLTGSFHDWMLYYEVFRDHIMRHHRLIFVLGIARAFRALLKQLTYNVWHRFIHRVR